MKWLIGILIIAGIAALFFYNERFIKTISLILRVTPYERNLGDAQKILILGDSTGYGTGAIVADKSIAGLIGRDFPGYSIENNSKNGRTIGELVDVARNLDGQYELILLQIGGNDILQTRPIGEVRDELETVVEALSDNTEHLVMISTGNVGAAAAFSGTQKAAAYEALTRGFKAMFTEVAANSSLTFVDLFLEPGNDPFLSEPDTYLSMDGLHPSDEGYAFWYEKLKPELEGRL